MKHLVPLLIPVFLGLLPLSFAQDEAAVSRPQETNLASPNARYQASVADHALEIRDAGTGKVVFHAAADAGNDELHFRGNAMLWDLRSRVLATAFGSDASCTTRLFARDGETFTEIAFPQLKGLKAPASIIPISWSQDNLLTVRATPTNGAVDDSAKERIFQVALDLKKKKARISGGKKSGADGEVTAETGELKVTELPGSEAGISPSLLFEVDSPSDRRANSRRIILPGETAQITRIPLKGSGAAFLMDPDRTAAACCGLRKESQEVEINIVSLAPEGFRIYFGIQRAAADAILSSRLGRQLFPKGGLQIDRIDSLTSKTAVLSASVTPESLGGATKKLSCTIQLRPDTSTELIEWHLSER